MLNRPTYHAPEVVKALVERRRREQRWVVLLATGDIAGELMVQLVDHLRRRDSGLPFDLLYPAPDRLQAVGHDCLPDSQRVGRPSVLAAAPQDHQRVDRHTARFDQLPQA
jgi:hypothetical protein